MLKGYYNFSGFVVSDWGATHSTSQAINAGLDIDMPDNSWFSQKSIRGEYSWQHLVLCPFCFDDMSSLSTAAISAGNVTEGQLQDSCMRIMSQWYVVSCS